MNHDYYRKNAGNLSYMPTTLEEERELFLKARAGDADAREFLIKNHLLFTANRARAMANGHLPEEDVISVANEALIQAVDRFNPEHGCRFTRYLLPHIRGAVSRLFRDFRVVRHSENGAIEQYHEADGHAEVQTGEEEFKTGGAVYHTIRPELRELVPSPFDEQVAAERKQARLAELHKGMAALTPKERNLVRAVYEQEKSFAEIARSRGVSRQAVEQALDRILDKMRGVMKRVS